MKTAATKPIRIPRPLTVLMTASVLLSLIPGALAQPVHNTDVIAHGTVTRLYVAMATHDREPETWIQYRTADQPIWRPFAQFEQRVISLSHMGGELVVLLENGAWQLIWDNGQRAGPPLPDRTRILALGTDGSTLFAVGRRPADKVPPIPTAPPATVPAAPATQPAHSVGLWIMQPTGWSFLLDLPQNLDPDRPEQVSLIAYQGQPIVAVRKDQSLRILRLSNQTWQTMAELDLPQRSWFKLVRADRPVLWLAAETGPGQILFLDEEASKPIDLVPPGDLSQPTARTLAAFDNLLYLVFAREEKLAVQSYQPNGTPQEELDTLAPPHPPTDPRINELIHLVVLAAMLFVLVTTLRQRRLDPIAPEAMKEVQLAALGPRLLAGLIDVSPFLGAMIWVVSWAQSMPDPVEALAQARAQWPVLLATGIYIVHTLVGEVFFNRSFGKWCLKLRIAGIDGHPPTPTAAAMRNLLRIIDLVVLFPLPLLLVLYTPLRQRIGDIAARTIVIQDQPEGTPPKPLDDEKSEV